MIIVNIALTEETILKLQSDSLYLLNNSCTYDATYDTHDPILKL